MYTVWHVDKYKITFKLVINWTSEILKHIVVSSGLSRPGIIDGRARYRAAARRLRNTDIHQQTHIMVLQTVHMGRDSSVAIATAYGLDGPEIESRWGRDFLHLSIRTLRPTQPSVQWVPGLYWG